MNLSKLDDYGYTIIQSFVDSIVANILKEIAMSDSVIDQHWVAIFFVLGVCIMLVFGALKPQTVPFTKPDTPAVSVAPWKWRWWTYAITITAMVAVTVWLSPLGIAKC